MLMNLFYRRCSIFIYIRCKLIYTFIYQKLFSHSIYLHCSSSGSVAIRKYVCTFVQMIFCKTHCTICVRSIHNTIVHYYEMGFLFHYSLCTKHEQNVQLNLWSILWPSINCLTWTCRLNNANFWDKNYLYRYTPIFPVKRNKKEMINVCTRSTIS